MANDYPVKIYSSGTLVEETDSSFAAVLEAGGNDSMFVFSGGTAVSTGVYEETLLVAGSGAEISYIDVEDGTLSGTEVVGSGASRWYGAVACATGGDIVLSGGTFTDNMATTLNGQIGMGGVVQVWGGTLTANGGTYASNSATGGGGAIYVSGTASIGGAVFSANSALYGGGVETAHEGNYTISGATFTDNSAGYGGGFENHQGASTLIADTTFTGNTAISGGAILNDNYQLAKCSLTVINAVFSGNTAEFGGAIQNDGVLVVSGGTFDANTAEDGKGGALYNNVGTATVKDAGFTGNTAIYGGAIWQGPKKLTLDNTVIDSNTAIYGGALYANGSGTTTIKSASFSGNSAAYDEDYELGGMGGALYVTAGATVTVTDTIFGDNFAEVNPDNEWDGGCGGAGINYGNLTVSGGEFSGNKAYYGAGLYNQAGAGVPMTVVNADFLNNSATYGGAGICNCWGELVVSGGTYSGNTVEIRDGAAIANWSDATVTGATFTENTAVKGGALSHTGTTLTVTDAAFNGNMADEGGAFWQLKDDYASPVAIFVNCSFNKNVAEQGGAIDDEGTQLTVSGGSFDGNVANDGMGGAIYTANSATVESALFTRNTAIRGGAIYANAAALTLDSAEFSDNLAIYGGALYANGSGATVVSGGSFASNSAYYDEDYDLGGMGGALYVTAAATVTVTDVIFEGNFAEVNPDNDYDGGCGGAVINYGNLTVTGGAFIANSAYYGAGLYNQAGAGVPMTVVNADFLNNSATYGGAGICNCWGELVVSGGTYSGNTVEIRDGAAIANWSDATVTGAVFTENKAVKGGALSHTGTTLTVTDAVFGGNSAEEGGAFWNMNEWGDSVATLVNCSFTGNTATQGGAIWNGEVLTIDGCEFTTASDTIYNAGTITVSGENTFNANVTNTATGVFTVALGDTEDPAVVNGWSNLSGGAISIAVSADAGYGVYQVAAGVGTWSGDIALTVGTSSAPETFKLSGGAVTAADISYDYNNYRLAVNGGNMTLEVSGPVVEDQAGPLGPESVITGGNRAAKWNSSTGVTSGGVTLVTEATGGNEATLIISGYEGYDSSTGSGTILYGAAGTSFENGTVNIVARSGSLRNLAGGAEAGGTVGAVDLTFEGTALHGVGYAGGFGSVSGKTATAITGGTFEKEFYAGALANRNADATSVGEIALTVAGGLFKGNLYGASAVKTVEGTGSGVRHTAGNVTMTVTGGEAAKSEFSCFAGGYATGDATGTVYTVGSVTAALSGGSWGEAHGGRGFFGGAFASGVGAAAGDVTISIDGGTFGNVYGGGWAQKGGASTVGDVKITIAGDAEVANVFGGGSHSTTGGSTSVDDVAITVAGGDITNAIYARGHLDGDAVTGATTVTFTGAKDYGCDVFGYSYVNGATGDSDDVSLAFAGYTGIFSGEIGGFNGIEFNDGTAMTLATAAADVSNGAWEFDLAARDAELAGTSLLTWSDADFTNDTIAVSFADETQAKAGWNIATVAEAFSGTTFGLAVGETEITGLAYGEKISGGAYDGWGFALEDNVLKFKHLA